jgi:molecular chaperone HscB
VTAVATSSTPRLDIQADDFTLFGLPRRFAQDRADIDARWKALQRETHPDRFAAQGATAQRVAMQWSVRVNEARQRLLDPVRRAAYLCELAQVPIQAHTNTAMPADFLLQQIRWREELEEASSIQDLDHLGLELAQAAHEQLLKCEQYLDAENQPQLAAQAVRALMFIQRVQAELADRLDAMS